MYSRTIFHLLGIIPPYFSQFSAISTIFCRKFGHYNNQFSILFVHYDDHIYPNSCITMTEFPQSTENTHICGIQFQISPNLCGFRNDLHGCPVIHAHDNREFFDCIVENNQKRLTFANITTKWCFWRVFTYAVGTKKGGSVNCHPDTDLRYIKTANHLFVAPIPMAVLVQVPRCHLYGL